MRFGDGFVARFVDLAKLTVGAQSEGGARLYDALDAAFDGFALLRAVRDRAGVIVDFTREYVNQIGAKLAGRTVEDLIGRPIVQQLSDAREVELFLVVDDLVPGPIGSPGRPRLDEHLPINDLLARVLAPPLDDNVGSVGDGYRG